MPDGNEHHGDEEGDDEQNGNQRRQGGRIIMSGNVPPEFIAELERKIADATHKFDQDALISAIEDILFQEVDGDPSELVKRILGSVDPMQLHIIREINGEEEFRTTLLRIAHSLQASDHGAEGNDMNSLLNAMSPDDKIAALYRVLMSAREDPRETHREHREHSHHLSLLSALSKLAEKLSRDRQALNTAEQATVRIRMMSNQEKIAQRNNCQRQNPHASFLDHSVIRLDSDLIFVRAFLQSTEQFQNQAGALLQVAEVEQGIGFADSVREVTLGFHDIVQRMKDQADGFSEKCNAFLQQLEAYHLKLGYIYCTPDDIRDRRQNVPKNNRIPLYNNNLHQTALLHSIETHIPAAKVSTGKREAGAKGNDLEYDIAAAKGFAEFLRGQGDIKLLKHTTAPDFFRVLGSVIGSLHHIYVQFHEEYEKAKIEAVFSQGPAGARQMFAIQMNQALEANSLTGAENVKRFNPKATEEILGSLDMSKPPREDEGEEIDWHPHEAKTPDDNRKIAIYRKIEEVLMRIGNDRGTMGWIALKDDIEELMRMKAGLSKTKQSRRRRLRQDKDRDNITYGVAGGTPYEPLHLEQIPSEPASWDDLVGSSWKDIRDKMDVIYGHAKMSRVFTDLAPRRQINSNAILIGPPGSGKNLAIRAMMSDPRTVGIATTVGDLMSEYMGRGQHNVTDLYEEAARVREEHDKPVIIALDEFDVMFPEKDGGAVSTIKRDMQKAFQAVLDGHTMRDGVFTVGLTNNPENIPAAVLRRFAHIEIIEALRYDERLILMQNLLGGIPTEKDFMKKVDWNRIMEESKFASGDTIGKVADAAYRHFVDLFENRRPGRLQKIHDRISDMKDKGIQRLSNSQKLQLFRAGKGKSVVLVASEFEQRALEVLESTEAQSDMRAQEQFYEVIRRKLDDGFMDRKLDNH